MSPRDIVLSSSSRPWEAHSASDEFNRAAGALFRNPIAELAAVAQDAHGDVREYIVAARTGGSGSTGIVPSLEGYTRQFSATHGIPANVVVAPGFPDGRLEPTAEAQMFSIIQEALTNVRKHAGAKAVRVRLDARDGIAEAVVEDDGVGFQPAQPGTSTERSFGLRMMSERAEEVGGTVQVHSVPSQGTRVVIQMPLGKDRS